MSGVIAMVSVVLAVLCAAILALRVETSRAALEDIQPEPHADRFASGATVAGGTKVQ